MGIKMLRLPGPGGKNHFDKGLYNDHGWYYSGGVIADATSANATVVMRAIPGKTYYFKHCSVKGGARAMYTTVENWAIGSSCEWLISSPTTTAANVVSSFTVPNDAKWLFILAGRVESSVTTATLKEQLADFLMSDEVLTSDTPYEAYAPYKYKPCVTGGRYKSATASDTTAYPKMLNGFAAVHLKDHLTNWDNTASSTLEGHKILRNTAFFGPNGSSYAGAGRIPCGKTDLKGYCNVLTYVNGSSYAQSKKFTHYSSGSSGTAQVMLCITNEDLGVTASTPAADVVAAFETYCAAKDATFLVERADDTSTWDYVKDTVGNTFGYLNRATLEYMPVYLATGTVDAVQTVIPYILKGGTT